MGLQPEYLRYIEESAFEALGGLEGKRMLELGDQVINDPAIPEETGKAYFENRGVRHTSFDLNGRHGAIRIDLSKPIADPQWLGAFDIVTNSGTTEHVEPFASQYLCFKNIHDCLKAGGVAVHLVPDVHELDTHGRWRNHCTTYYSDAFFERLAALNSYEVLSRGVINGLRCAALRKGADAPFTEDREALLALISHRRRSPFYTGSSGKARFRPLRWLAEETAPLRLRLGHALSRDRRRNGSGPPGPGT